jgi:3-dehydroquinate synthase
VTDLSLLGYTIHIAAGALDDVGRIVARAAPAHRHAIVTDSEVGLHYRERVRDAVDAVLGEPRCLAVTVPAGEATKTRATWASLTDFLLFEECGRDTVLIALGGGMVGDLTGFVAATFMRGIPYVQVPTSLLAMVDASVGGKTGVDTTEGKNLVGAFHQPAAVLIDPLVLGTLPPRHLRAGLAEVIKHGVIADGDYLEVVGSLAASLVAAPTAHADAIADLVTRSVEIKASIVARDEREQGIRAVLNFGHTIGHAIEAESDYAVLHGEAVAIGMVIESLLAEQLGVATSGTAAVVRRAVEAAGLPSTIPEGLDTDLIVERTLTDKKRRAGSVLYALPRQIGEMAGDGERWATPVDTDLVRALLHSHGQH